MSTLTGTVLFCFDGSNGSQHALIDGGSVLRRGQAVVLTVWKTVTAELAESGAAAFSYVPDEDELDTREEVDARAVAERGAAFATAHGWDATARSENAPMSVWQTIIDVADDVDASVIVCGARGMNALKRAVLGSVSEALLHHSGRPTLVTRERHVG